MDWGGKYRGTVARLAGLLHLAESGTQERQQIPLETLERAIVLGEYFQAQAIGVFSEMGLAGASEACRVILEWIRRNGRESFKKRELHRALDSRFPKAEMLTEPLTLLEERGYLREAEDGFKRRIGRPTVTYEVNPAVFVEKPMQEVPIQWEEGEI